MRDEYKPHWRGNCNEPPGPATLALLAVIGLAGLFVIASMAFKMLKLGLEQLLGT
jgi:hypothetical protein